MSVTNVAFAIFVQVLRTPIPSICRNVYRIATMADGEIQQSEHMSCAKRKRMDDARAAEQAKRDENSVREYLGRGGKLWVVARHVFPTSRGSGHIDHEEFVFADKTMAKAARDAMIEDVMVQYIDLRYDAGDNCTSTDEDDCHCRDCGDRHRGWLHEDPVAFAEEYFHDAMQYIDPGVDGADAYIRMTEWKPPVVLSSVQGAIPLTYTCDVTTTHAYQKYYPTIPTDAEAPTE